jgi:hypothetical protein
MEIHVTTSKNFHFKVIKEEDDPITNRLSIGGSKEEGCYIVFRGDINDCYEVLENALEALNKAKAKHLTQNN